MYCAPLHLGRTRDLNHVISCTELWSPAGKRYARCHLFQFVLCVQFIFTFSALWELCFAGEHYHLSLALLPSISSSIIRSRLLCFLTWCSLFGPSYVMALDWILTTPILELLWCPFWWYWDWMDRTLTFCCSSFLLLLMPSHGSCRRSWGGHICCSRVCIPASYRSSWAYYWICWISSFWNQSWFSFSHCTFLVYACELKRMRRVGPF